MSSCRISISSLIFVLLAESLVQGAEEIYSNSFISPNSAGQNDHLQSSIIQQKTLEPIESLEETQQTKEAEHGRFERSPDPILSRTSSDIERFLNKNIEETLDSNDVELSGRHVVNISPSKTEKNLYENIQSSTINNIIQSRPISGEEKRAPQARSLGEPTQSITPTATVETTTKTSAIYFNPQGEARQVNPDIQDIITGIVKLLNGNVNVQANTVPPMGRPLRPLSSRINNRGPPRISELPALPPDFDLPAPPLPPPPLSQMPPPAPPTTSSRLPTPYPFEIPPSQSSMKPHGIGNKRPGLYRPTVIPPWSNNNRLSQRRPGMGNRRPTLIPPYKPLPNYPSITTGKPNNDEDILNLDLGTATHFEMENENVTTQTQHTEENSNEFSTSPDDVELESSEDDVKEISDFEKNKSKVTKKSSKTTSITPTIQSSSGIREDIQTTSTSSISSTSTSSSSSSYSEETEDSTISTSTQINPSSTQTSPASTLNTINISSSEITKNISSAISPTQLESSIQEITVTKDVSSVETPTSELLSSSNSHQLINHSIPMSVHQKQANNNQTQGFAYYPYRPRPGIVLDDTEYKPGGGGLHRHPPIITRPPSVGQIGDIFDVTVSAIQGPGGGGGGNGNGGQGKPYVIPVDIDNVHVGHDVITSPDGGSNGFVSIDGKRTYLNLFGDAPTAVASAAPAPTSSSHIKPSSTISNQVTGTGYAVAEPIEKKPIKPTQSQSQRRPAYGRPTRPTHPPVRIDTCIVGDDSTCDSAQHETCLTENGVSSCHCRPGFTRRKHRDICRKIVSVLLSLRVDKLYESKIVWRNELGDKNSEKYQTLAYEAEKALDSAMSMTPFSDEFLGAKVNGIYSGQRSAGQAGVFVNLTLQLEENPDTSRPTVRNDIQKHLLGVIQRRSNNIGKSALWVDSPPGSVSNLQDLDECSSPELHDCHQSAKCINHFGGFKCECLEGFRDQYSDSKYRAGRFCEQCSNQYCNNRGECKYKNGQEVCICSGNYYGNQCELDGEVLGVAIGASVAAIIIIGLTLVALVMWSRKWQREQKASIGSPVFGYMAAASNSVKTPVVGGPPYQLTLEDRLRWAQLADAMAQANHYAPEPVAPTRPSSAMFGYPNLGTMQRGTMQCGTLPPVPLPRLTLQAQMASRAASLHGGMKPFDNSSSSEEEDKADLLGRSFQVPRPKSRSNASIANQSGIYYDVDYDQQDIYKQAGGIPMSTYSMGRPGYFRN